MDSELLQKVADKQIEKEQLADEVIKNSGLLSEIFSGLDAKKAEIKFGCDKILRLVSRKRPDLLYPKIDFIIVNLHCENTFLKLGAIEVIANLTAVDEKKQFEKIFDTYFAPIPGPVLVTAANIVKAAGRIAKAKPGLSDKIARQLLKVEKAGYQSEACRDIALGHTIESFGKFFPQIKNQLSIIEFVRRQLENPWNATRKKAEKFLRKHAEA